MRANSKFVPIREQIPKVGQNSTPKTRNSLDDAGWSSRCLVEGAKSLTLLEAN
jgi:hypothetical protein